MVFRGSELQLRHLKALNRRALAPEELSIAFCSSFLEKTSTGPSTSPFTAGSLCLFAAVFVAPCLLWSAARFVRPESVFGATRRRFAFASAVAGAFAVVVAKDAIASLVRRAFCGVRRLGAALPLLPPSLVLLPSLGPDKGPSPERSRRARRFTAGCGSIVERCGCQLRYVIGQECVLRPPANKSWCDCLASTHKRRAK
jgi:hypothetical protein